MNSISGDLLALLQDGTFDVIVHGCNCRADMSGGLAAQVAATYPLVDEADREYELQRPGRAKAGTILPVPVEHGTVVNAYTQLTPGPNADPFLIKQAMWKVRALYANADVRIGMPKIGCGIGGLEWSEVEPILEKELGGLNVTIVEYEPVGEPKVRSES